MTRLVIHTEQLASLLVVRPAGELDLATSSALSAVLLNPASRASSVVLDLSGVSFIDSTGLSVIVAAYRHGLDNGYAFSVAALTPTVARRFEVTSLDKVIPIHLTADGG